MMEADYAARIAERDVAACTLIMALGELLTMRVLMFAPDCVMVKHASVEDEAVANGATTSVPVESVPPSSTSSRPASTVVVPLSVSCRLLSSVKFSPSSPPVPTVRLPM